MSIKHLFGFPIIERKDLASRSDIVLGDLSSYIQVRGKLPNGKKFNCLLSDFPEEIRKKILEIVK